MVNGVRLHYLTAGRVNRGELATLGEVAFDGGEGDEAEPLDFVAETQLRIGSDSGECAWTDRGSHRRGLRARGRWCLNRRLYQRRIQTDAAVTQPCPRGYQQQAHDQRSHSQQPALHGERPSRPQPRCRVTFHDEERPQPWGITTATQPEGLDKIPGKVQAKRKPARQSAHRRPQTRPRKSWCRRCSTSLHSHC